MGVASKVILSCLRVVEFGCACVITGVLGKFFRLLNEIDADKNSRLIFAMSMAVISIFFSIILILPLKYSFYAFALDFAFFVCWITCFALLEDVRTHARTHTTTRYAD
jgi:hypothetical protein